MQADKLAKIGTAVMSFFSSTIKEVGQKVRFVKRKSKVDAELFAQTLIIGCLSENDISLDRLCLRMREKGVSISKQGLHKRFNAESTNMMRDLFAEALKQLGTTEIQELGLLKHFSGVKITDSSTIALPNCLQEEFRGCGGNASLAGLKLQVTYDYLKTQLDEVSITQARENDFGFRGHWNWIEQGTLHLQDLGYFNLKFFEAIQEKKAYFVSRYFNPTKLWSNDGTPLNLLEKLRNAETVFEENIALGQKARVVGRLIAMRLPEAEAEKRRRVSKRNAQKKGMKQSQELIELMDWSIYITNIPGEWLNAEQVYLVYTLRWQIELLFKLFKSEAGIDQVSGRNKDRVLCEIYAKLICLVNLLHLCRPASRRQDQELSLRKAYRILRTRAAEFYRALQSRYRLAQFIRSFLADLPDFAFKDKHRKKRPSTRQKIVDGSCIGVSLG